MCSRALFLLHKLPLYSCWTVLYWSFIILYSCCLVFYSCCPVLLRFVTRVASCYVMLYSCCVVLSRVVILVVCEKIAGIATATLLKRRLQHRCYHVKFVKFLKTAFFIELFRRLLL